MLAGLAGGDWPGIYGLSGILIAHVFFNLPLATRLFLQALDTIPDDQWREAACTRKVSQRRREGTDLQFHA